MSKIRELTADETASLVAFAKAHGGFWKGKLRDQYWYNARVWNGQSNLHALRNDPAWGHRGLDAWRMPVADAAPGCPVPTITDTQEAAMIRAHKAGVAYADRADGCPDGAQIIARGLAPREHEAFAAGYLQAIKRKLKV